MMEGDIKFPSISQPDENRAASSDSSPSASEKNSVLPASYLDRVPKYISSSAIVIDSGSFVSGNLESFQSVDELLPQASSLSESNSGDDINEGESPPPAGLVNAHNYLTYAESSDDCLTITELSDVVSKCQDCILKSEECSEERRWLVRRLIELRYRLVIAKESLKLDDISPVSETRVVRGHHFSIQKRHVATKAVKFCERCCRAIWSVLVSWYECQDCGYECHIKCIENTVRVCANVKRAENPNYELRICPETNLVVQSYKCAECKSTVSFRSFWQEPRLCDYDGKHYCPTCHWNTMMVLPARVIHNWDFTPYAVSRASYQHLKLMLNKPLIPLEKLNPRLFGLVDELAKIKKLREDILVLKRYMISCRIALEKNLAWKYCNRRKYFLEDSERYSLQDLIDIKNGALECVLEGIHSNLVKHVKVDCLICFGRGYRCELCPNKNDVIFPFDPDIDTCLKCETVYHHRCWQSSEVCTKCERIKKRSSISIDAEEC